MAVQNSNFNTLITAIDTKAQSLAASTTDPKDLVYLAKSLEALNVTATVSDVIAAGDTKVTAVNTAGTTQVGVVQAEGATQVAAVTAAGSGYATSGNVDALRNIILVTVAGGKLVMDGTSQQALKLTPSVKYRFDQSDSSNATHPLQFSITDDGTHGGGAALTAGVTVVGTAGSANAYVEITLEQDAVATYYYCANHAAMGGTAYTTTVAGGGGGANAYSGTFALDADGFDLQAQGNYLTATDLTNYGQAVRIRGMDTATKAYAGVNCMTRQGSSTGNMEHSFILLSANQTTGDVQLEQVIQTHNNGGSINDYSTYAKASDEWTGRYSYMGHIPRNGASHNYGYDQVFIASPGGQQYSTHNNDNTFAPSGNNNQTSAWVNPSEHRLGGAVNHYMSGYYQSNSRATAVQFKYGYSTTSLAPTTSNGAGFSTSITSTNYQVQNFNQFDVSTLPYYDAFHSVKEGLYAHRLSNDSWQNLGAVYNMQTYWHSFFLSNGSVVLVDLSTNAYLINTSGTVTTLASSAAHANLALAYQSGYAFAWNVGTDEWLQALPNARFCKFKINPSTGQFTQSNILSIEGISDISYDNSFNQKYGLWSQFNPSSISYVNAAFTYGTEHASGYGYGRSKLFYVGGDITGRRIHGATYDIADLVSTLAYP